MLLQIVWKKNIFGLFKIIENYWVAQTWDKIADYFDVAKILSLEQKTRTTFEGIPWAIFSTVRHLKIIFATQMSRLKIVKVVYEKNSKGQEPAPIFSTFTSVKNHTLAHKIFKLKQALSTFEDVN